MCRQVSIKPTALSAHVQSLCPVAQTTTLSGCAISLENPALSLMWLARSSMVWCAGPSSLASEPCTVLPSLQRTMSKPRQALALQRACRRCTVV